MTTKTFFLITVYLVLISCSAPKRFQCPMANASIVFVERKGAEMLRPSSTVKILGDNKDIYSSSKGQVTIIDSLSDLLEVHIESKEYIFIYHNIAAATINKGDKIKKGQYLGYISPTDSLEISIIKNGIPYMPNKILKCPVKYMYE